MGFKLIELTDQHMTRPGVGLPRNRFFYPSEASVKATNEHGETEVLGNCIRSSYYRLKGVDAPPADAYSQWIFALGTGVEKILIEQWKQMGIWVANSVKFFDEQHKVSGEIDVLLSEPGTGRLFAVECCTPDSLVLSKGYTLIPFENFECQYGVVGNQGPSMVKNLQIKQVKDTTVYRFRSKFDGLLGKFTGEHPIQVANIKVSRFVADQKRRSYNFQGLSFKDAQDIQRGDYVTFPKVRFSDEPGRCDEINFLLYDQPTVTRKDSRIKALPTKIKDLSSFYWLLGLYMAEGSCSDHAVYFSLHQEETDLIDRIRKIVKDLFGFEVAVRNLKDSRTGLPSKGINVEICSTALCTLFKSLVPGNTNARTKRIAYDRLLGDPVLLGQILSGIWAGDGTVASEHQLRISTAVPNLAFFYFQLAAICGKNPRVSCYKQLSPLGYGNDIYYIEWSDGGSKRNIETLIDCGACWAYKVKAVDTFNHTGTVYNLECSLDNTYTVGGLITHNCKSFYNHYATKEICGSKRPPKAGRPKDAHLLQTLLYVDLCKRHNILEYAKLVYYARDSGSRAEFDVEIIEDNGLKRPMINGVIDYRFTVDEIYDRYKELEGYIERDEEPPRDFQLKYDTATIEKKKARKAISKTAYEKWQRNPSANPIGDWQCSYCQFKGHCWSKNK